MIREKKKEMGYNTEKDERLEYWNAYLRKLNTTETSKTETVSFTFDNSESSKAQVFERYFVVYIIREWSTELFKTEEIGQYCADVKSTPKLNDVDVSVSFSLAEYAPTLSVYEDKITETYLKWQQSYTAEVLEEIQEDSDQNMFTAGGWHRLLMFMANTNYKNQMCWQRIDWKRYDMVGNKVTVSGKVSDSAFTNVQQYFTHPLGDDLRYAWLYNGITSQPGAQGYDYARPAAVIQTQALQGASGSWINTDSATTETYEAWYIKYAGKDAAGKDAYYLALEGTDGKRHLLCRTAVALGDGTIQDTLVFVTAAEYAAHPELYQTSYAWPITKTAADSLSVSSVSRHQYKGFWQKTADEASGDIVTADGLKEEAFRVSVSGGLLWTPVSEGDNKEFFGFENNMKASAINEAESSLYAYYLKYKDDKTSTDGKLLSSYSEEINKCLTALENLPAAYIGLNVDSDSLGNATINGKWENVIKNDSGVYFSLRKKDAKVFSMCLALGTYTSERPENTITVKSGQVYTVANVGVISEGQKLVIEKGGTLQITGTLINKGTLCCYGTVQIEDGGILRDPTKDAKGTYVFTGGTLIISENGMFIQSYNHPGSTSYCIEFNANSTIFNDGFIVLPRGCWLSASTLNNGTNGVILCGCSLRADPELYSSEELLAQIPRGMPTGDEIYNMIAVDKSILVYGVYSSELSGSTSSSGYKAKNSVCLTNQSVFRNNGAFYDMGGITMDENSNVLIGMNQPIHYADLVVGTRTDADGNSVSFDYKANAYTLNLLAMYGSLTGAYHWDYIDAGTWYTRSAGVDYLGSDKTNYVKIGSQSVAAALAESGMDDTTWQAAYCKQGEYKAPDNSGC